jgi:dTDP-4-dehydrorhamnose reductase
MVFRVAGLKPELQPTNEKEYRTAARRPKYSVLSNAKMESCGVAPMPPLQQAVEMYLKAREKYFDKK